MRSRLAATVLALAALAGLEELLHSATGARLLAAMNRFYDVHHGLGEPCSNRAPKILHGGFGMEFDVPGCWSVTRVVAGGIPTDTVLDPGLRQSFHMTYIRREDADLWARAMSSVELRRQDPMTTTTTVRDWQILSCATQRPGFRAPNRYYEWTVSNDRVVALVVFEIHKFYVESPKVIGLLDSINGVLRSVRLTDTQPPETTTAGS
jgi:hypothetical protein